MQIDKLINLHHLYISYSSCLNIPLPVSKLKSLHVLVGAKFLLGGSSMEDLVNCITCMDLYQIQELQNVVDRRQALKAKMREKIMLTSFFGSGVEVVLRTIHKLKEPYLMSYAHI